MAAEVPDKTADAPSVIKTQEAHPPEINVSSTTASVTVPAKSVLETPVVQQAAQVTGTEAASKVPELKLPELTRKVQPQADTVPKGEAKAEAKPNAETKAETMPAVPPAPAVAAQMPEPGKAPALDGTQARPETKGVPEAKTATDVKAALETKAASVGKAVPDAASSTESKDQSEVSPSAEAKKSSRTKSQSSAQTDSEKRIQTGTKKESEAKAQPEPPKGMEVASKSVAVSDKEKSKREEEVNAALASLSPIFENLEATVDKIIAAGMSSASPGPQMATSAATAKTKSVGPRWIAECVPLSDGESHLLLESEMEKAYAVVDSARRDESAIQAVAKIEAVTVATPVSEVSASTTQEAAVPEKANDGSVTNETPAAEVGKSPAAPEVVSAEATSSVIAAPEVSAATSIPEMPAEVIFAEASQPIPDQAIPEDPVAAISAPTEQTPPVELKSPPSSESADVTTATSEGEVQAPAVAANQNESEGYLEIALAAAASAGSTFIDLVKTDPAKNTTVTADQAVQPVETGIDSSAPIEARVVEHFVSEPSSLPLVPPQTSTFDSPSLPEIPVHVEDAENQSRLAAAWQNWRQIRESIVGDQAGSAAPATGFKQIREKTEPEIVESAIVESAIIPSAQSRIPDAEQVAAAEESALASIVDSVLAEMKPRLMAEIARKLGKDPK